MGFFILLCTNYEYIAAVLNGLYKYWRRRTATTITALLVFQPNTVLSWSTTVAIHMMTAYRFLRIDLGPIFQRWFVGRSTWTDTSGPFLGLARSHSGGEGECLYCWPARND